MTHLLPRFLHGWKLALLILTLIIAVWSITNASAYYSYVRSPLRRNTYVTSTWSHPTDGYPVYYERALDLQSSGESVYSYLDNPSSTDKLYYQISDYKVNENDCPGSKFLLWDHTPGGDYFYYGRINYVHLTDHSGKWGRSWDINPGQSESDLYIGYTTASCNAPVHLHVGHMIGDGMYENIAGNVYDTVAQSSLLMYH